MNLKAKATGLISNVKTHWKTPAKGRYMPYKEIAAYAGGGIGAYFLINMGSNLLVSTTNMIVGAAIGVSPTHMYLLYIISTLINVPLTAVRANMIDNTRNKAGKYRPYLISMGIPTALISLAYVWFPYESLYEWFPNEAFGFEGGYIVKCITVLIFNLLLIFFFNFFNDAYTNLIHVLSPNTQERTDVLAIKSVVYSLAPSIVNIVLPIVAQIFTNDNLYDIRVYRIAYPVFTLIGIVLTMVVFGYTKEKIVQAKTRIVQVKFKDAFKSVAKNKYFWIISLAGWLGFLEGSYANILSWSYNYGHLCTGSQYSLITTLVGNASLWGMLLAPIFIRKFGKKLVLIGVNTMNIVCILSIGFNTRSIIWIAICVYFNYLFGAFEQITTPAIQADIRDFHQFKTGERVDGAFASVKTIGDLVTLATSSVLPFVYEEVYNIKEGNGYATPYEILDVNNTPGLLDEVLRTLIIMAAVGAFLNMVPYLFYDLTEKKQAAMVKILKIRAMFEDYANGVMNDSNIVEAIDIIKEAKEKVNLEPIELTKNDKKRNKKAYKEGLKHNDEISLAKQVCEELDKFSTPAYKLKVAAYKDVYSKGLLGLYDMDINEILTELKNARELPKNTVEEKELRKFAIEIAQNKLSARKAITKYFPNPQNFVQPDFSILEKLYDEEDECNTVLKKLYVEQATAKKSKDTLKLQTLSNEISTYRNKKKQVQSEQKKEIDKHAYFNRAAKVFLDAEKLVKENENYSHLEEIFKMYGEAKQRVESEA